METKKEVRRYIKEQRDAATDEQVAQNSEKIAEAVAKLPQYGQAACVYAYIDYNHEVMTDSIIFKALEDGKRVAVPRVEGKDLVFCYLDGLDDLESGYFGIREPKKSCKVANEKDALFIMPGVAFDKTHHRVGYGGGFYDRYLEKPNTHYKVELAFDFQVLEAVPYEPHDILIDLLVTESTSY